ncbi:hypothetical protein V6N13_073769 [Hibiscus sabdariffa]
MDVVAVETLNNPRKHRRFDKEPPDRGGPGNRPSQPDVVVDADGIMVTPSYKDSLLHGSGTVPGGEEFDADDDIDILEGEIIEYEYLPSVCFLCGLFGHTQDSCSDIVHHQQPTPVNDLPQHPTDQSVGIDTASVTAGASKTAVDNTPYGPWMVVEPRPRPAPRKQLENNARH